MRLFVITTGEVDAVIGVYVRTKQPVETGLRRGERR